VSSPNERPGGLTVLEVLVVVGIIAILATISVPVISGIRGRAQRIHCLNNLRNLHAAADLYVQQNGAWPQINTVANKDKTDEEMASLWIAALQPFGPTAQTWICPTIQGLLQDPDHSKAENTRVDYIASSFDDKPTTPHEWPRQPWFVENGDVHGSGNLIVFADGSISDLKAEAKAASPAP
jgi:type II secretory pathway pseudopilin PulG